MKKYIKLDGNKITLIHNMPFDPINGLHQTEEDLLKYGVLLDEIPDPQPIPDKIPMPYYSAEKGVYYEYKNTPLRPEDEVKQLREIVETLLIESLKS